jgi:protein-glutamine gamma-glutamyltransferase
VNELPLQAMTYPRRALRAAIFLIAVECLMLAWPSQNWLVTGGLFLIAASRWWTIRQGWCLTMPLSMNSVFLAALFAFKFSFAPADIPDAADFANSRLAHEIGCWLVAMQVLLLHESSSLKRIPVAFTTLGCLVVLCAGDVRLHHVSRTTMLMLIILFVGGLGWFAHAGRDWIKVDQRRRLRRGILVATLIVASVPTIYAAQAWHHHERDLEMLLLQLMKAFDDRPLPLRQRTLSALALVSDGKIIEPEKPVLRVTQSGLEPLYLRGVILDTYRYNPSWITQEMTWDIHPREAPPERGLPPDVALFPLVSSDASQWDIVSVTYLSKDDSIPLSLLDTAEMDIAVSRLRIDSLGNLRLHDSPLPDRSTIYTPLEPERDEAPPLEARVRRFPRNLDPRVLSMAQALCAGKSTDTEKIRAVESFFRENYLYQIGLEPPAGVDRIAHFLLHQPRPAAHCEYFASGAAILLRAVGIPTRYVTGYVPSERHSDGYWIARRKDAHAWAEAYDSELGRWVTVEATPSEGLPERRTASWRDEFAESWRVWFQAFRETVATHGTWTAISLVLQSMIARGVLIVVLLAFWWAISHRYRRQRAALAPSVSTRVFPFQQWLKEVETDLAQRGFERLPHETLLHFRDRILASPEGAQLRPAAEWYAEYSAIRYDESQQTPSRMSRLRQSWHDLNANVPGR